MSEFLTPTIFGLVTGAAFAIAASGLVITYATSNVFNVAHGAVGMVMAFLYWQATADPVSGGWGWPGWLGLLFVVLVAAPAFGAVVERTMMRHLTDAPVSVSLTVTVGLLVALIGFAQVVWPPEARRVEGFLDATSVEIGGAFVTGHQILTFLFALGVAGLMFWFLKETRIGIGMRAIVDNRDLLALHGARPALLGMLSWALGSALAALAGIMLAPELQLDYIVLTLLVVNAYAAAMVGQLTNLPRTFVGALILGLVLSYFVVLAGDIPSWPVLLVLYGGAVAASMWAVRRELIAWWAAVVGIGLVTLIVLVSELPSDIQAGLRAGLPALFLMLVMIMLPQERLRVGSVQGATLVKVPSWTKAVASGIALVVATVFLVQLFSTANVGRLGVSLAFGLIMLSLVVLTGYGGDVSLGQMTFVGVGALIIGKWFGGALNPFSILVGGGVAALVGALIAIPALRLRGLYLGLLTLAFAAFMDKLIFENRVLGFALGGNVEFRRPGWASTEEAFTIVVSVAFVLMAWFVLWLRRGRYGRYLLATRDSPAACATLGLNITATRVTVFAISAGMAGIAGGLFAGMRIAVGAPDFLMFQSLPLLLLAVVGGITSVTGALLGGLLLGMQDAIPGPSGLDFIGMGAIAIALARNPNGIAGMLFRVGKGAQAGQPAPDHGTGAMLDDEAIEGVSVGAAP